MALFLGVDVGGSKTECALGDEARLLSTAQAPSAKLPRVTPDQARAALQAAVQQACASIAVAPHSIQRCCVGTAGASRAETVAAVLEALSELTKSGIDLVGDMEIAQQAAFAGEPGIVVISGTGSIAYGVNPQGLTARAGGWGAPISDEGSGDWIVRTIIADALLLHDSAAHSALLHHIMESWNLSSPAELARLANSSPPPDFAALFPQVALAADAGDTLARDVLIRAAHELAQLAMIVVRRLWPADAPLAIAMSGGVFENAALLRDVFTHVISTLRPHATVFPSPRKPVEGALMLARIAAAQALAP